jgi:short-subunit dehydrogenase
LGTWSVTAFSRASEIVSRYAVLPHFRANKGGTIVNVSPGAGVFTVPMLSLSSASKFA